MNDYRQYLRPSSSHAWLRCPGYGRLNASIDAPEEPANEVRDDGIACHWLAQTAWHADQYGVSWPKVDTLAPNGRIITDEMIAAVYQYHAVLRNWLGDMLHLEQQIPVGGVFDGVQDGTPDAYTVTADGTLHVGDLKYGFRPVEVWRNTQLTVYAWTLMQLYPRVQRAELTIIQPRAPHRHGTVRTWSTTRQELEPLARELQMAAREAAREDAVCIVSSACRDCMASAVCPSLKIAAGRGIDDSFSNAQSWMPTPDALGYELTKLLQARDRIDYRINGLTAEAESLLRKGKRVPGFAMERAATRYRWRDGAERNVRALGALLDVQVDDEPKLKSPSKLADSFPNLDVKALYAVRPDGELRLQPVDPNEAVKAFTTNR